MSFGFTFNGVHSSTFGIDVTRHNVPYMPELRETEEVIPGIDGIFDFGTEFGKRVLSFGCEITTDSVEATSDLIRNLFALVNPKQGIGTLTIDSDPSVVYKAKLTGDITPSWRGPTAEFTISFKTSDPFAHINTEKYDVVRLWDSGERWPNEKTVFLKFKRNLIGLDNLGVAPVIPKITVTGAISAFTLSNKTTSKTINYGRNLVLGDVLVIDVASGTVTRNGVTDGYASGDITTFTVGTNANDLLLTCSSAGVGASITFEYDYVF